MPATVAPAGATKPGGRVQKPVPASLPRAPATVAPAGLRSGEGVAEVIFRVATPFIMSYLWPSSQLAKSPAIRAMPCRTKWGNPTPCAC